MASISRVAFDRRVAESNTSELPRIGSANWLLRDDRQVGWIQPKPGSLWDLTDWLRALDRLPNMLLGEAAFFAPSNP
jgi:hypothetical protein